MIRAFRQKPVDESRVDAIRRKHRVRDAHRRILIEVETRCTERKIHVGDDGVQAKILRDRERDVMRDGRGADAAFRADHGKHTPERFRAGRREQSRNRAHEIDGRKRRDEIITDAAAHELAIENDVVVPADDNDLRAGVANLGKTVEARDQIDAVAKMLDDENVRRRGALVGFKRGDQSAHLDFHMGFGHAAIADSGLHRAREIGGFAKSLNGNARNRHDVPLAVSSGRNVVDNLRGSEFHHGPTLLTLPLVVVV